MELPKILIDGIQAGRVFLFLGAGASLGALHPKKINPPTGQELSEKIAKKFLGPDFAGRPLAQVAELAQSETDLFSVQSYVASEFMDFYPADFHKLIPHFVWPGIATTNFDLIIERAYESEKNRIQNLVPFKKDGERVEDKLRLPNSVMYLKLHGCISNINDEDLPLILTVDQYITHKKCRTRLFSKLTDFYYEYPFLYVGSSLADPDIRAIQIELSQLSENRPRSYIISPRMTETERRFWDTKKISTIEMTFEAFINYLHKEIPEASRKLSVFIRKPEHPIFMPCDAKASPSESLIALISRDVDYLHRDFPTTQADAKAFYKGYFVDWAPIANNLDVKRTLTEELLSEVVLIDEAERSSLCDFYVILGHAGSGKSVLLKRLAWDAATEFNKLCLFKKQAAPIEYEPIAELYRLRKERIFLFIDPVSENIDAIEKILKEARKDKTPLTIIATERPHEWNTRCEQLEGYMTGSYGIDYLNLKEIKELVRLLSIHKSLGYLQGMSVDAQIEALSYKAGRQLLVALHEATLGKPFSDIVFDEYNSISTERAKSLYLTICVLHRLGIPIRAGLISRVHGISFSNFKNEFFKPLEFIVFARMNPVLNDYIYQSRHPHIAEIVIERVLSKAQDRYDEYIRIINALDIDFVSDREAFKGILNARELLALFQDAQMIRRLYQAAGLRYADNTMLLQQEAIFEMQSTEGSIDKAASLLEKANKLAPYNRAIVHSLSELALKKSERAPSDIEARRYRKEAKSLALSMIQKGEHRAYPYHTIIKVGLAELEEFISKNSPIDIENKTKELGESISKIVQLFPDDSYIRDAEATFCDLIDKHSQALLALKKAFTANKASPYIASRLSKVYEHSGNLEEAIRVLEGCLEANPNQKSISFQLAMLLMRLPKANSAAIRHHLRHSFIAGDSNYAAQFWYARLLYLEGSIKEARDIFKTLREGNIDTEIKMRPRGIVFENGKPTKFKGTVSSLEASYAFITRDDVKDVIFTHRSFSAKTDWGKVSSQKRVTFSLAFNYRGPVAVGVKEE